MCSPLQLFFKYIQFCLILKINPSVLSFFDNNILLTPMFNCFKTFLPKCPYSSKDKYYEYVSKRLKKQEIVLLGLIYNDLACRNSKKLLTFDHFLVFFDLKGLWGAKLFKQFDEDGQELVTFEQFLYGISRTAKAPMDQKIKLLYAFFESNIEEGIDFKSFTKMLYNYSKEELKQILVSDGLIEQVLFKSPNNFASNRYDQATTDSPMIQINCQEKQPAETSFDMAYESLLKCHDEGTFYEINKDQLTYTIRYSNMSTLINEFAVEVYAKNGIDVKKNRQGRLKYESFSNWIQDHKKLFKSYYSAFRTEMWSYDDSIPRYLDKIELEFTGNIICQKFDNRKVYGILVQSMIIFFNNKKSRYQPLKIICLEGLNINVVNQLSIEISHSSENYKKTLMKFQSHEEHRKWLQYLEIFERDSLHQKYLIGEVIGTGKFSIVYKCIQKISNKVYALKVIETEKLTDDAKKHIRNESEIMKILNHPQLIKYKQTIHSKSHEYIITEYVYGEELFEYVRKRGSLNEFESAFIIGNIIKAVKFTHEMGILHRDLKPQNIMVLFKQMAEDELFDCTSTDIRKGQRIQDIKIIDFGFSNHISEIDPKNSVGTPNYIAPEAIAHQKPTFQSDVFSIGGILYFLLSGTLPYNGKNLEQTLRKTVRGQLNRKNKEWKNISQEAKDLIQKLLQTLPEERISLEEAMNHKWFNMAYTNSKSKTVPSKSEDLQIELGSIQDKQEKKDAGRNSEHVHGTQEAYVDANRLSH